MVKQTRNALLTILATLAAASTFAAIPVRWTTDTFKVKPLAYECYHGETLDLAATLTAYGDPIDLCGKTARLWWQTADMGASWYETNATVRVDSDTGLTNILAAVWSGAFDTGKDKVTGFIGVVGENYRASFTLSFRASPGFTPSSLPLPPKHINWAEVVNESVDSAPFVVKGGAGGVTSREAGTIATNTVEAKVAPWAMKGMPEPSGGDPNAVTNVCTNGVSIVAGKIADIYAPVKAIAESAAVTNAGAVAEAKADAEEKYLQKTGGTVTGSLYMSSDCSVIFENKGSFSQGDVFSDDFDFVSDPGSTCSTLTVDGTKVATYGSISNDFPVVTNAYTKVENIDISEEYGDIIVYPKQYRPNNDYVYMSGDGLGIRKNYCYMYLRYGEILFSHPDTTSYTISIPIKSGTFALTSDIPTDANIKNLATNAVANSDELWNQTNSKLTNTVATITAPIATRQDALEGYIAGQRVRVSVTNYYGNTSGELPRLRIEEFIVATNVVDGVQTETNYWQTVWDEQNKYNTFLAQSKSAIAAMTNDLYQTYYTLLMERLNTKAPRAWGTLTSAGTAAPAGSVWHTEPNTVFAGGTEYAHAMVGTGVIGVLTTKGAAVYTDGETGRFHFTTDDRQYYFGMNIASRYELGCATDGITVTKVGGNNLVQLTYNVTMSNKPILYFKASLDDDTEWEQITDSSGAAISGASVVASWEQSPPAGSEICNINGGTNLSGFFKASVEYAGSSKFETNMMADFVGGIIATNQTTNQSQPIEPYITNGEVHWRIKQ